MQNLKERLYGELRQGSILVMPTEESARSILSSYVFDNPGVYARKSQAIAFDRFRASLFPEHEGQSAIGRIEQLLFASYIMKEKSSHLSYFLPRDNEYTELLERLVYFIASLLSSLEKAEKLEKNNPAAVGDIRFLKKEYDEFLASMDLYDPAFEQGLVLPDFPERYVIVLASTNPAEKKFFSSYKDKFRFIDVEDEDLPCLEVYDNEKQEIRNTFLKIRQLIKEGVDLSDIAITTASYERTRPYLESEGYLFSIPLQFRRGKSPLSYPAGAFVRLLRRLYENDYQIEDVKEFFLNPAFPFISHSDARAFVISAISRSIAFREDEDRYAGCARSSYYRDLVHYNRIINTTDDGQYMIREIKSLMEKIFTPEQFSLDVEDERVLSFIFREASSFSLKAETMAKKGFLKKGTALFPLLMKYLESTIYVPQEKVEGVAVYPLGQTTALLLENNFVLSLNEKEARAVDIDASFLSDYEVRGRREDEDSTKEVLLALWNLGTNVTFSSSRETYAGYSLSLTEFKNQGKGRILSDSYAKEAFLVKEGKIEGELYAIQKLSHDEAAKRALRIPSFDRNMTWNMALPIKALSDKDHPFSHSQIDKYRRCPYLYALDYGYGFSIAQRFVAEDYPALEIGNRLHRVIEKYFKYHQDEDVKEVVPELYEKELESWADRKMEDKNGLEVELDASVLSLTPILKEHVYHKYVAGLISTIENVKDRKGEVALEKKLGGLIEDIRFTGFADCIVTYPDSSYSIIDFKTGSAPSDSLQFDIYNVLLDRTGEMREAVYMIIKDGRMQEKKDVLSKEEVGVLIKDIVENIRDGVFSAANTKSSCEGCTERGICRRRFFIQ